MTIRWEVEGVRRRDVLRAGAGLMAANCLGGRLRAEEPMRKVGLKSAVKNVQPMTGIVLWATNGAVATAPIQLEYSYLPYRDVAPAKGVYDWSRLDRLLEKVASRGHQLILRWHDTYVGKKTGVPQFVVDSPGYKLTRENSEGKPT
jgi:hypothetical protein